MDVSISENPCWWRKFHLATSIVGVLTGSILIGLNVPNHNHYESGTTGEGIHGFPIQDAVYTDVNYCKPQPTVFVFNGSICFGHLYARIVIWKFCSNFALVVLAMLGTAFGIERVSSGRENSAT